MSGQGEASNMTMQNNEGNHGQQQQQRQHIPPPHPSPHHSRPSTPMPTNQQELEAYVLATEQRMNEMRAQAHQQLQQLQHTEQRLQQAQQQLQQNQHVQQHAQPIHAVQPVIRMRELKLPEPKEFRGTRDRTSIREWINDIEEIFTMGGLPIDHHTTIVYAAHYLHDDAKTWYKMHKNSIMTWDHFQHLMIERYKDPREVDKARMRLMTMKQISSVEGCTTAFDRASLELAEVAEHAPRDEELIFMYREGLKQQIKTFLAARGTIGNLRELQEVAMEIDAAMNSNRGSSSMSSSSSFRPSSCKSGQSSNHNSIHNNDHRFRPSTYHNNNSNRYQQGNRFNHYRPSSSFNRFPSLSSHQQNSNPSYVPMDTSNNITQQRHPLSPRVDNRSSDRKPITGNCFNCGKAGHFARDCPSNKQAPNNNNQQRNNIIMQESSPSILDNESVLIINEVNDTRTSKTGKHTIDQ